MQPSKIWLSSPHMGGAELNLIHEAFATNWIAPLGPHVNEFEKDLSGYTGMGHAAALSSGTAALHLALILLGVERGDEVMAQSFTFSATVNPIVYQGAVPVLIDSEESSWNMCPDALEKAIRERLQKGKKPKAIIPVHLYGMPARIDRILAIAAQYDIPIIEDAAEALGSRFDGKPAGSFGRMAVLSFNGNKIITTSGGGALLSDEEALISKARFLATQARDPAPHYQHSHIGYNYRMSNIVAGIGRGQMQVLEKRVSQRRANFAFYEQMLASLPGLSLLQDPGPQYFSNRWLTTVLVDPVQAGFTREDLRLAFEKDNIETRPLWKPMHLQPVFSSCPVSLTGVSERLFNLGLCLPSGSNLTDDDRERIMRVIRSMYR